MIVEERCYTVKPGTVHLYYQDYDPRGLEIQTRILGNLIGYFHTEIGELNQIVHLWGYEFAGRARAAARVARCRSGVAGLSQAIARHHREDGKPHSGPGAVLADSLIFVDLGIRVRRVQRSIESGIDPELATRRSRVRMAVASAGDKEMSEDVDILIEHGTLLTLNERPAHRHRRRGRDSRETASPRSARPPTSATKFKGKKTIDASMRLVMPGLVDGHAHLGEIARGLIPDTLKTSDWLKFWCYPYMAAIIRGGRVLVCEVPDGGDDPLGHHLLRRARLHVAVHDRQGHRRDRHACDHRKLGLGSCRT